MCKPSILPMMADRDTTSEEPGFQLAYEEAGSVIPLILLHGNGEDRSYFRHQIEDLQDIRHVYALDTRGHGQSPRGTAPFTLNRFVRDLEEFMDQNGIEQADLLGFSDGANIALLFALNHPERESQSWSWQVATCFRREWTRRTWKRSGQNTKRRLGIRRNSCR